MATLTRNEAFQLLKEYTKTEHLITHALSVEGVMRHFATLEKLCSVLECEPGDILVLKKRKEKSKK